MTADVCDVDELNTGKRREGILGAVYWWTVKFGQAFAGLLAGLIMWLVDFDPDAATQSSITGLRWAYSVLPIIGVLGAIWVMRDYDISEEQAAEVREKLADRKSVSA